MRILVVEDEPTLAAQLAATLQAAGYAVDTLETATDWNNVDHLLNQVEASLRQGLAEHLDADDERLLELLADRQPATDAELPDTGIGQASERLLSSIFIHSAHYGTRASTLLRQFADGRQQLRERRFGPLGQALGEARLHLPG